MTTLRDGLLLILLFPNPPAFEERGGYRYDLQNSGKTVHFETLQRVIAPGPLTQLNNLIPDKAWRNRIHRIVEIR